MHRLSATSAVASATSEVPSAMVASVQVPMLTAHTLMARATQRVAARQVAVQRVVARLADAQQAAA